MYPADPISDKQGWRSARMLEFIQVELSRVESSGAWIYAILPWQMHVVPAPRWSRYLLKSMLVPRCCCHDGSDHSRSVALRTPSRYSCCYNRHRERAEGIGLSRCKGFTGPL